MTMSPGARKFALAAHLTVSVGWIGAAAAYLALAIAEATRTDGQTVRAAWIAMELTGWYAVVPMAVSSLATGLIMALGTRWGLFHHYWVVISLVLTLVATAVLLLHMPDVSRAAAVARTPGADIDALGSDLAHPALGLAVLIVIEVLNVYKPQGVTRRGLRSRHNRRATTDSSSLVAAGMTDCPARADPDKRSTRQENR